MITLCNFNGNPCPRPQSTPSTLNITFLYCGSEEVERSWHFEHRRNFYLADVQLCVSLCPCIVGSGEFPVFMAHNNADAQGCVVSSG